MISFSKKLIIKYKNYFKQRFNKELSDKIANVHLENLVELYCTFYEISRKRGNHKMIINK
jgi:hypothetical protein